MPDMPPADNTDESGVLRPFVDHPHEPLPPVVPPEFVAPQQVPVAPPAPPQPMPEPVSQQPPPPAPQPPDQSAHMHLEEPRSGAVFVSKTTFVIVVSVMSVVIAGLAFLWQQSNSDGSTPVSAAPSSVSPALDQPDGKTSVPPTQPPTTTIADNVDGLLAQLTEARAALSAAPAPALPGTAMQRIVVSVESSFVSANDTSVAVVGPFGNLANIDPTTNAVVAAGQVSPGATRVLRTASAIWITDYHDGRLIWVDPVANSVKLAFDIAGPDGLAKDGGSLLVSSFDDQAIMRFDPFVGKIVEQVDVGGNPTAVAVGPQGGIWAAIFNTGELVRIDPASFTISDRIPVGSGPVGIALSPGTVWVANHDEGTVAQVSMAERAVVATIPVGAGPTEVLVDSGSLWVTATNAGDLLQIEVDSGRIITRTPLGGVARGGGPTGISAGAGSIWVAIEGEQSVVRITPPG